MRVQISSFFSKCIHHILCCRFLILDPHYTGGEDLKVILDKVSLCVLLPDYFYNCYEGRGGCRKIILGKVNGE